MDQYKTREKFFEQVDLPSQNMQSQTVRKHVVTSGFLQKLQSRFEAAGRALAVPGRDDIAAIGARGMSIPEFDEDIRLFYLILK